MAETPLTPMVLGPDTMDATGRRARVLIVDNEPGLRALLTGLLAGTDFEPIPAATGEAALQLIRAQRADLVLLGAQLPGMDGLAILSEAKRREPQLPVVVMTGKGQVRDALRAMRAGAFDYLVNPFDREELLCVLQSVLGEQPAAGRTPALDQVPLHDLFGCSTMAARISGDAERVAGSDFTVLITGESGTGKEVMARAIHGASARVRGPFIVVDCGAVSETGCERDLFGEENEHTGRFEQAGGGTLFLDDIFRLPASCQARLLRVLQEKAFYRAGATRAVRVDTRGIAAARVDPTAAVAQGPFRRDLYFRLNEFVIHIPPLRQRGEDILFLARRFVDLTRRELRKPPVGITEPAEQRLLAYDWPGNVRQLQATVRRAALLADVAIDAEHLGLPPPEPTDVGSTTGALRAGVSLKQLVRDATSNVERAALMEALTAARGNKTQAARLLQIDSKTIRAKLKEHGIGSPRRAG
jgi:DNA-binding NtrC family response regulator